MTDPMSTDDRRRPYTEEFRVSGERVLAKVKELVHEGIEIPLTIGVIGTVLLPVWAAIGAIAALAANLTIAVERYDTGAEEAGAAGEQAAGQTDVPPAGAGTTEEQV